MGRLARWERGSSGGCRRRTTRAKTTRKDRAMEDASSREGYIQHATTGMDGARKMIGQGKKNGSSAGRLTSGTPCRKGTNPGDAQSACRVCARAARVRRAVSGVAVAVVSVHLWRAAGRSTWPRGSEEVWQGWAQVRAHRVSRRTGDSACRRDGRMSSGACELFGGRGGIESMAAKR